VSLSTGLPEDEPSGSKNVEDKKFKNQNINLPKVYFVGFYYTNYI
jgi:hypothetical protein